MQIKTKIDNSIIPQEGNSSNFFKRLSDYIGYFDSTWSDRIKGATKEDIGRLEVLSGIQKSDCKIPLYYQIFLDNMGEDDGVILTSQMGTSCINEIIELYEEIHKFEPETLNSNYLIFYNVYLASQIALEVGKSENPLIVDYAEGEVCDSHSENFEKLLFQLAFRKYVKSNYTIRFGTSGNTLKDMLNKNDNIGKSVFDIIEFVTEPQGFKKIWISDNWNYIGINPDAFCVIRCQDPRLGFSGYVTGASKENIVKLANLLANELGAHLRELE